MATMKPQSCGKKAEKGDNCRQTRRPTRRRRPRPPSLAKNPPTLAITVAFFLILAGIKIVNAWTVSTRISQSNNRHSFQWPLRDASTAATAFVPSDGQNNHNDRRRRAPNRKTQLRWIAQSFEKLPSDTHVPEGLTELVQALATAGTTDQVTRVGRQLAQLVAQQQQQQQQQPPLAPAVRERLIKVAATTGLLTLAVQWTLEWLDEVQNTCKDKDVVIGLPSPVTQDAVGSALRRAGRVTQLRNVVQRLASTAAVITLSNPNTNATTTTNGTVSLNTFNLLLAALCDTTGGLVEAWTILQQQATVNTTQWGVSPDAVSYATLLQAAARQRDWQMGNQVWQALRKNSQPNLYAYHARLQLLWACRTVWQAGDEDETRKTSTDSDKNGITQYGAQRRDPQWQERSKFLILLVDDEESLRKAVGTYLDQAGYQVTTCASGEAALEWLDKHPQQPPDLMVSDIRMPGGMDGLELLQRIRQNPDRVSLPVVLLTAKGQTKDRIAGYDAGADAYIPKPFAPEELLSVLDNLLERQQRFQNASVTVEDLRKEITEIKDLLQKGGAGAGVNGFVEAPAVFLAPDERRVLELLCEGLPNKEMAAQTFVSTRRVEQILTSLYRKAGVVNRTELISSCQETFHPAEEEMLHIWNEMLQDPGIQPDRFTIDLILPVLAQRQDMTAIKNMLDEFVMKNPPHIVSNAFSAFMVSLNKSGRVLVARALFQAYIQPYFEPTWDTGRLRLVTPTAKHFNIILNGYRQEIQEQTDKNQVTKLSSEAWELFHQLSSNPTIAPDEFSLGIMMALATSPEQLCDLVGYALDHFQKLSPVLQRSALTSFGQVGDAPSALWLFSTYTLASSQSGTREWNVLLGTLSKTARAGNATSIGMTESVAARRLASTDGHSSPSFLKRVDGLASADAAGAILELMIEGSEEMHVPSPDTQSFCLAATALQYGNVDRKRAMEIFHEAQRLGLGADGRFLNAILRCFGSDIQNAVFAWKQDIRPACVRYENRKKRSSRRPTRTKGKNLVAAYNGLLYCCGRALRPDIGVRLVYAMVKEGLEPNENTLNAYRSGKRQSQSMKEENLAKAFVRKLAILDPYESLLFVECTKYDRNDRRRAGEARVRIIL